MIPLLFGLFFLINFLTLHDGHNWGDDFAQYILHAVNLAYHKPYASDITYDLRILCPPGFPMLLSPVVFWTGINFKIFKSLNVLLWALSAVAAYGLSLTLIDRFWARLITLWFLTSPFLFFFKQNVLSDIPFMCFILLSLWTFMKYEEYEINGQKDSSQIYLYISIFFMSYSFLTRWSGVTLFLAVILYSAVTQRNLKNLLKFILGGVIALFVAVRCGSLAMGFADKTTTLLLPTSLSSGWYNLGLTFKTLLKLFISDQSPFSTIVDSCNFTWINTFSAFLLLGIIGSLLYRLYLRKTNFMECFALIYLIGVIFWPVYGGARYLLPLMIPLTIYVVASFKPAWRKRLILIFVFFICQNIFVIASNIKYNNDDIYNKQTLEMFQWVNLNIKPEENYMFGRPRALALFTHRVGHSFGAYPQDVANWYKRLVPLHINYLIVNKSFDQFSPLDHFHLHVGQDDLNVDLVWKNDLFKILKVQPRTKQN